MSRIERLLSRKQDDVDRSKLLRMYLNQANQSAGGEIHRAASRVRQDGKFAQNRRRTVGRLP
jgi:hypothetical protein